MTHAHVRGFAEERYTEMLAALDTQVPRHPGDEQDDVKRTGEGPETHCGPPS